MKKTIPSLSLAAVLALSLAGFRVQAADPDFGPNVLIFDPSMKSDDITAKLAPIMESQRHDRESQFNDNRYAILFKPGKYDALDVKVGFYMHVIGLGESPDGVEFTSGLGPHSAWYGNVTQTFWRGVENFSIDVVAPNRDYYWGVSQGCTMRNIHVKGPLKINSEGWASGGFLANCRVEGGIGSGSQQQWMSRNALLGKWSNAVWNMVFVGVPNAPTKWPSYTAVDKTPLIAEKPFIYVNEAGKYFVKVPPVVKDSDGVNWGKLDDKGVLTVSPQPGASIPIEKFYLAHAGKDTAASINKALAAGKDLILTPGIYHLEESIKVVKANTVVLGIGYPTLIPDKGTPALTVADVDGVRVGAILFQAAPESAGKHSSTLLEVGEKKTKVSHAANPTIIYDIFARVGGAGPGETDAMVTINSNDVIGDNAWLWRADHGAAATWADAKNKNGIVVNGDRVIYYGLAVEHTQEYQTVWNGEAGRVYFYQSEIPYDVPDQKTWRADSDKGYASYKIGDNVKTHEAWGLGIYSLFNAGVCVLNSAYEVPANAEGVKMHHLNSINLGGHAGGNSGIAHVVNDTGGAAQSGGKFARATLDDWPVAAPAATPTPAPASTPSQAPQ